MMMDIHSTTTSLLSEPTQPLSNNSDHSQPIPSSSSPKFNDLSSSKKNDPSRIHKSLQEPQSWGELLNSYRLEKSTTHDLIQKPEPIYRQTRDKSYTWRQKQREINPILQQFIDPEKESKYKELENELQIKQMNRAMDKAICLESHFDIVTLKDKRRSSLDFDFYFKSKRVEKGKKMISDPSITKFSESKELIDRQTKLKKFKTPPKIFDDFFLIYKTHDADRLLRQELQQRDEFIKTRYDSSMRNKFHPILQSYRNDEELEKVEREKEENLKRDTLLYKLSKEPQTIQKLNEGKAYNIISKEIIDRNKTEELQSRIDIYEHRQPIAKVKYNYEKQLKEKDAFIDKRTEERALNSKTSTFGKREALGVTDYNILNGEKKSFISDLKPAPIWKQIEKDISKSSTTSPKTYQIKLR
ncbi:hypothetical protein C9374_005751 [Naegleria lovaniensis]|uniref:Uncharacterized protein n=1 Tax=Naegleria lovaniensis TaxID=51637 RepID=A0AA88GJ73_NAELO|nr:uncharacterized protein C9374_005751 [Naegleria lovaniensis]KAG2381959.1 hypothetical protein C9374_005751 [Naegleria lovaniensis]